MKLKNFEWIVAVVIFCCSTTVLCPPKKTGEAKRGFKEAVTSSELVGEKGVFAGAGLPASAADAQVAPSVPCRVPTSRRRPFITPSGGRERFLRGYRRLHSKGSKKVAVFNCRCGRVAAFRREASDMNEEIQCLQKAFCESNFPSLDQFFDVAGRMFQIFEKYPDLASFSDRETSATLLLALAAQILHNTCTLIPDDGLSHNSSLIVQMRNFFKELDKIIPAGSSLRDAVELSSSKIDFLLS